ncbi:MAG: hypothetical protein MHMPM18_001100 [Marteilia pararefringens]
MASIEMKNSLNKFWEERENENHQIHPSTIMEITQNIYKMIMNSTNNKLTSQLVEVFKNLVANEPKGFYSTKFFTMVSEDIKAADFETEGKSKLETDAVEKAFVCLKNYLKQNQLVDCFDNDYNLQKVTAILQNTRSKLNIKNNSAILEIVFKIERYFIEAELSEKHGIADEKILNIIEMQKITFTEEVLDHFLDYENESIQNQRASYYSCLTSLYKCLICLCACDDAGNSNAMRQEAFDLSINFSSLISKRLCNGPNCERFLIDTDSDNLFYALSTLISCLFHNPHVSEVDEDFAFEFITQSYLSILHICVSNSSKYSSNMGSYLISLIMGDYDADACQNNPKYDTIRQCLSFSFNTRELKDRVLAHCISKLPTGQFSPNYENCSIILLVSWVMDRCVDSKQVESLCQLIINDSTQIKHKSTPMINQFIAILFINSAALFCLSSPEVQISACNFLFNWIQELLHQSKESDGEREPLFECALTCLTNIIDDSELDTTILDWLKDHTVPLINLCLNINLQIPIESGKSGNSSVNLDFTHNNTEFERFSAVKSRLLQVMSNFELEEVCKYSLNISSSLSDSILGCLSKCYGKVSEQSHHLSDNQKEEDDAAANKSQYEISCMLRALENLILICNTPSNSSSAGGKTDDAESHENAALETKFMKISEFVFDNKVDALFTDTFDIITALTSKAVSPALLTYISSLIMRLEKDDSYYEFKDIAPIIHNCLENVHNYATIEPLLQSFTSLINAILSETDEIFQVEHEFTLASKILEVILLNFGKFLSPQIFDHITPLISKFFSQLDADFNQMLLKIASCIGVDSRARIGDINSSTWSMFNLNMVNCLAALYYANKEIFEACIGGLKNVNSFQKFITLIINLSNHFNSSKIDNFSNVHNLKLYNLVLIISISSMCEKSTIKESLIAIGKNNCKIKCILESENTNEVISQSEEGKDEDVVIEDEEGHKSDHGESQECSDSSVGDGTDEDSRGSEEFVVTQATLDNYKSKLDIDGSEGGLDFQKILNEQLKKLSVDGKKFELNKELDQSQLSDLRLSN